MFQEWYWEVLGTNRKACFWSIKKGALKWVGKKGPGEFLGEGHNHHFGEGALRFWIGVRKREPLKKFRGESLKGIRGGDKYEGARGII